VPEVPSVAVIGAVGYAGAIAAQLIHRHPSLELRHITARAEAGRALDAVHPRSRVPLVLEEYDPQVEVDAAVVCYPHGAAAPTVAELRARGIRVVDLSADFRLHDRGVYEAWYGTHGAPDLLAAGGAVYGLPELHRDAIRGAHLVANPGCYPTAALLALAPLARAGLVGDVVIDAKSGVSGAGRAATATTHFVGVDGNVLPYKVGNHRHTPEIEQELALQGAPVRVTFVPHLVPLSQGELTSCYVQAPREIAADEVRALYAEAYAGEAFVELADGPPAMTDVRDTNVCRIFVAVDERTRRVMVFSVIDNLWKGAASQAVQNLNLMFGFREGDGL
jgi:N-acetyl-gamma-glutamyl-phosphate reductase